MKKVSISIFALTMLIVGAVDGVSNLPSIALFGSHMVFFFIVATILFLWPTGSISAELSISHENDSGIYIWVQKAFGGSWAGLAVWLQWINTMVWFPTCLTTLVGTLAYLINPVLIHKPLFLVVASLSVFWFMTVVNLWGVKKSSKIAALGTTFGMVIPMALIIGLSLLWVASGRPLALHLSFHHAIPNLSHFGSWTALTAIITAFLGMELATVHVKRVKNASVVFPVALLYALVVIILTMGLGSFFVAMVIPHHQIVLVSGAIQAFHTLFEGFHLPWMSTVVGVMLVGGSIGAMVNWLISPANSLAQTAVDQYLPISLAEENKYGVPYKILLLQGVVVSLVSLAFFLLPSVNGSYWLLLDLSTELYLLMYLLMFMAAIKLVAKLDNIQFIPFGKAGAIVTCCLGLLGCSIAILVGFIPPSGINVGSHWHYVTLFVCGIGVMCSPALLVIWHQKKNVTPFFLE